MLLVVKRQNFWNQQPLMETNIMATCPGILYQTETSRREKWPAYIFLWNWMENIYIWSISLNCCSCTSILCFKIFQYNDLRPLIKGMQLHYWIFTGRRNSHALLDQHDFPALNCTVSNVNVIAKTSVQLARVFQVLVFLGLWIIVNNARNYPTLKRRLKLTN